MRRAVAQDMLRTLGTSDGRWQHKVYKDTRGRVESERWLTGIPHMEAACIQVYKKGTGAWYATTTFGAEEDSPEHAPALKAGPFADRKEAMHAADAWCRKWAPRLVGLPGVYAVRVCSDGKIRVANEEYHAGQEPRGKALTPDQARALAEVLMLAAEEVEERPAQSSPRSPSVKP